MNAVIFTDPTSRNDHRQILVIPASGRAPQLFMEWQSYAFVELNEVWVIVEQKRTDDIEQLFYIKFRSTGADVSALYQSARDYINNNI